MRGCVEWLLLAGVGVEALVGHGILGWVFECGFLAWGLYLCVVLFSFWVCGGKHKKGVRGGGRGRGDN